MSTKAPSGSGFDRSLAPNGAPGYLTRNPLFNLGPLRSLSLWRRASFEITRATISSLSAPCIALGCGAVFILGSPAKASRHFWRVRSLSLWRGAQFCSSRSCAEILARRSLVVSWRRDLATGTSFGDLVPRPCQDLAKRALLKSLCRDL